MTSLVFVDVETTGLDERRAEVWEVALILRSGYDRAQCVMQVELVAADRAEEAALRVGRWQERRLPDDQLVTRGQAARLVSQWTAGAVLVGVNVHFDLVHLTRLLRRAHQPVLWHYQSEDVRAHAAGWLRARGLLADDAPPWSSYDLSRLCGVEPPAAREAHTALGDALWAERWWDHLIMG